MKRTVMPVFDNAAKVFLELKPVNEKKDPKKKFVDIARLTSVGIGLVLCAFIGYWIGNYIDHKFHTAPIFMVIFLIIGMGAGILNVFRTLSKNND